MDRGKRFAALMLALLLILLAGCGGNGQATPDSTAAPTASGTGKPGNAGADRQPLSLRRRQF